MLSRVWRHRSRFGHIFFLNLFLQSNFCLNTKYLIFSYSLRSNISLAMNKSRRSDQCLKDRNDAFFLSLEGIIDLARMKKGAWKRVLSRDVARRASSLTLREKNYGAAVRVKGCDSPLPLPLFSSPPPLLSLNFYDWLQSDLLRQRR